MTLANNDLVQVIIAHLLKADSQLTVTYLQI